MEGIWVLQDIAIQTIQNSKNHTNMRQIHRCPDTRWHQRVEMFKRCVEGDRSLSHTLIDLVVNELWSQMRSK